MFVQEPTAAELAAIEDEWPVIEAEMAVVTAECRLAMSPDVLSLRAHARAVAALAAVVGRPVANGRPAPSMPESA